MLRGAGAPSPPLTPSRQNPPFAPQRIIELVQKNRHIKLAGNQKLRIERELAEPRQRAQLIRDVLRSLGQPEALEAVR